MVKEYRKRPVTVRAVKWTGDNFDEICEFVGYFNYDLLPPKSGNYPDLIIHTLEGKMHAEVGDYIIQGVHGEHYPCKPDIFSETYEVMGND